MEFTDEQKKVRDIRDHNVLVSAAAGSGKTAVIVERIIRKIIDDGIDIDRLLIVTFTKAAAAEMKERIRKAIEDALAADPDNEHLEKQMSLVFSAPITTIDSFCLEVIRNNFNICGIDPAFRVGDEGELMMLRTDTMSALMDREYEKGSENSTFFDFLERFSVKRSDSDVTDTIMKLYDFAQSRPDPKGFLESMAEEYEIESTEALDEKKFIKNVMDITRDTIGSALRMYDKALELCTDSDGPAAYLSVLSDERDMLSGLDKYTSYRRMYEGMGFLSFGRLPSRGNTGTDPEKKDRVQSIRNAVKKKITDIKKKLYEYSPEKICRDMKECLPSVTELSRLTAEFTDDFTKAKHKRGIVDFSDLEHIALDIFRDEETRERYREHFEEIIIDEYQDSNRIQEALFSSIAGKNDYFCVGDVKQSIYSFRDACPEIFMEKYASFGEGKDENSALITLSMNFRSRNTVLQTVNQVFSNIMRRDTGGIDYDDDAALHYGNMYCKDRTEDRTEFIAAEEDASGNVDRKTVEAHCIADRIKELVGRYDVEDRKTKDMHKCRYHDIVILLRAVSGWDDIFMNVLKDSGIPAHVESKSGYLLSDEIRMILNFLDVIDNPRQDIPLAGVLAGIFGGFDESSMALIRGYAPDSSYYDAVRACAAADDGELSERTKKFIGILAGYRKMVPYTTIHDLISRIIDDFGYDYYVRSMPSGDRRLKNLQMLLLRARDFEKTSYRGLFHFIRYIENMKKYDMDFGEADIAGESDDAVRIMSIHHSKGLEFPVVFLSGLSKKFNRSDARNALTADDELGAGIDMIDPVKRVRYRTLIKNVITARQSAAALGEELRILYVAMTRAEEKLIMTYTVPDSGNADEPPADTGMASSMSDLILLGLSGDNEISSAESTVCMKHIPFRDTVAGALIRSEKAISQRREFEKAVGSVTEDSDEEFRKQTVFDYPFETARDIPQKVSVSFLKHEAMEEAGIDIAAATDKSEHEKCVPRFISGLKTQPGGPVIGALRGTAYHTAFENLPFGEIDLLKTEADVGLFAQKLVRENKLSAEAAGMIDRRDILKFVQSSLASRMAEAEKSGRLFREQPFVISVKASDIDEKYPDTERIMVQGIIDAFFEEDGEYIIIDYKTDRVKEPQELTDRYRTQLDYYAGALEQITGKKAAGEIIYSVALGMEIRIV